MEMMGHESSSKIDSEKSATAVINPWLSGGLVIAVFGYIILSGMLILKLGGFEDTKRRAQEAEATLRSIRTELSSLRLEVDSLEKQRGILAPTIADWEKRLKEKAEAEAALAALESKRRQAEADNEQAVKRLDDTNKGWMSVEKLKADLSSEIEKLKAERLSLTKANTAAKVTLEQATEAERRLNTAQNELASLNTQRKQLEAEVTTDQKRRDQIQGEADGARKERERLADEVAKLRQQVQTLKDEKTVLDEKVSGLNAIQATVQQEERKLAEIRQRVSMAEARINEIEGRQKRAASEEEQLTKRLEPIRKEVIEGELRRDRAKTDLEKAGADLSIARKLLQETSAKQGDLVRESLRLESAIAQLKKEKEALEKEVIEGELRRDRAKTDLEKADTGLSIARKLLQETSTRQGELVRESSRLENTIERLKQEKETREKELVAQEGKQPKSPTGGQ